MLNYNMKIIFITRESKQMPAVRVRCYGFAKYLNAAGIKTDILSFADDLGAKSGKQESRMSVLEKIWYNLKALKFLGDKEAVLFLQRCNYHSFSPLLVSLLSKKKLILDLDDWEARENTECYFNRVPNSKAEIMMRFIAKHSVLCVGASRFLVEYLLPYNQRVIYLPTAVDTNLFTPGPEREKDKALVLSWLGTMHRKDNVENIKFLLDCFQELHARYPQISLEIIGEGLYDVQVRDLVQKLGNSNVLLKPWISPEYVPRYLREIDIGIMPLIQNTKFNKAKSPTRLFEYMAMAKPVVVSRVGEAKEIINDGINGLLAQTKEEFVEGLNALIINADLRRTLGNNARKTVEEKFSLEKVAAELVKELKLL